MHRSRRTPDYLKYVAPLALLVVAASLVLAALLQRQPLLTSWYNASGVMVAAVGSVAVLSLVQSEQQEARRNDRESALLTLGKCTELQPRITRLTEMVQDTHNTSVVAEVAALMPEGMPLTREALEALLRETAPQWIVGYNDEIEVPRPHKIGPPVVIDKRTRNPQELADLVDTKVAAKMTSLKDAFGTHRVQALLELGTVNAIAAYIIEADGDIDVAKRVLGDDYVACMRLLRPVLSADADTDAAERAPFAWRLYDALR